MLYNLLNCRRLLGTMLVLASLNLCRADTVTLTDNGNRTVTMANNEVSMTFSTADGSVSSFHLTASPGTNLIDPKVTSLQLARTFNQGTTIDNGQVGATIFGNVGRDGGYTVDVK